MFDEIINTIQYYKSTDKETRRDAREIVTSISKANAISNASIATRARLNICQFPLLTSSTISTSTYQKVNEILEQLYAQYLKLVIINSIEVIDLSNKENKYTIINKVHQNDNAIEKYSDRTRENLLKQNDIDPSRFSTKKESVSVESLIDLQETLSFLSLQEFSSQQLIDANKSLLKPYNENFNFINLNHNNVLSENYAEQQYRTKFEERERLISEISRLKEEIRDLQAKINSVIIVSTLEQENLKRQLDKKKSELTQKESELESIRNILKDLAGKKSLLDIENEYAKDEKRKDFRRKFGSITDFDNALIRKNNQLEPTILSIDLKYYVSGSDFENTKLALAVKTITHLIQSDEMNFYINETLEKKKKVFRFIQVLTGEREFSLRFLLHLDEAKRDAKADSITVKWWRHLKARRAASWLRVMREKEPFIPNATLILSKEDHELLKMMYKKDLIKDTKLAYQLTDLLFLLHLVIVDDVNNEIMLFNKDTRNWETYTLDKLQSEVNSMNKMTSNTKLR